MAVSQSNRTRSPPEDLLQKKKVMAVSRSDVEKQRSDNFLPLLQSNDPAIIELDLREKYVTGATISLIGNSLTRNTNLRSIDLSGNALRDSDVVPLFTALRANRGVTRIDLSFNEGLTEIAAQAIIDCIVDYNSTICEIELGHTKAPQNMIDIILYLILLNKYPRSIKPLAYKAILNDYQLYVFQVVYDESDERTCNEETTRLISKALMHNTFVRTLSLDKCCRGEAAVAELRDLLANNHVLSRLSLRDNYLGPLAVKMICKAIERAGDKSMIDYIDLSDNPDIDDEGCGYIEQLLVTNGKMRMISLLGCTKASPEAQHRVRVALALNCEPPLVKKLLPELLINRSDIVTISIIGSEALNRPSKNYLTSLGATTLAESLHTNTFVHTLDFRFNHIGPDGAKSIGRLLVENPHITSIDLERNPLFDEGIRYLILAMRKNDNCVRLNVDRCEATPRLVEELCALCHLNIQPLPLKQLLALEKVSGEILDLSRQRSQPRGKLPSLQPDSMPYVLTILRKNRHLTTLDLSDNITLDDEGIMQLVPVLLDEACRLSRLVFPCTGISDRTIDAFNEAMSANYTIRSMVAAPNSGTGAKARQKLEVSISLNHFPSAVKDIVPMLTQNVEGVWGVEFPRKEGSYPPFGDDTAKLLFQSLAGNNHVTTVVLSRQRISNRGLSYGCECLLSNKNITSVDLSFNDIGPDGAQELACVLENNTTLTSLNLAGNPLTEVGGSFIAKALHMSNRSLRSLDVSDCKLLPATKLKIDALVVFNGETAGEFRGHVLDRISSLTALQFFGDPITGICTDKSCKALQLALRAYPNHLTSISLKYNNIGDDGVLTILEIIAEFKTITSVNLQHNTGISPDVVSSITATLQEQKQVVVFDISSNPLISPVDLRRIGLTIELNAQSEGFRKLYYTCGKRFSQFSGVCGAAPILAAGSSSSTLSATSTLTPSPQTQAAPAGTDSAMLTLDASYVILNPDSMRLILQLVDECDVANVLRGANFKGCHVNDDSVDVLCNHTSLKTSTSLFAVLLDNNQITLNGLLQLQSFAEASTSLCSLTVEGNPAIAMVSSHDDLRESITPRSRSVVEESLDAINMKLTANRDCLLLTGATTEESLAQFFRDKSSVIETRGATSTKRNNAEREANGAAARRTLEEEQLAEKEILGDALADRPKRAPYFRGKYANLYKPL